MSAQPRSHQAQVVKISFDTMQSNPNKHIREHSALGGASAQKGRAVPVSVTPIAKQTEMSVGASLFVLRGIENAFFSARGSLWLLSLPV